jgi:hypothetical protein
MTTMTADTSPHNVSPEYVLTSLLGLMGSLKTIYTEELDAMARNDTKAFMDLQPDKQALSRDYEMRVKEVQARAASIKESDPVLRQKVIAAQTELEILADRSQQTALRMAEAIRRLHERLIFAAREAIAQEKIQYTHRGSMHGAEIGKPIATAINEAI